MCEENGVLQRNTQNPHILPCHFQWVALLAVVSPILFNVPLMQL